MAIVLLVSLRFRDDKEERLVPPAVREIGNSGVAGIGECLVGQGAGDGRIINADVRKVVYLVGQRNGLINGGVLI